MNQAPTASHLGRRLLALLILFVVWAGLPLWAYVGWGLPLLQKVLTVMALPAGAVWNLLLLKWLYDWIQCRPRRTVVLGCVGWMAWGVLGNGVLVNSIARIPERPYRNALPPEKLKAVVVLGGGVGADIHGRPMVSGDGQRAILAAQLFHQGRVERIIATGSHTPGYIDNQPSPADITLELFTKLGIPRERLVGLTGLNTQEELDSVKTFLQAEAIDARSVGLITSAFHLPRAMRLAETRGLDLVPIAATFTGERNGGWGPMDCIPTVEAFGRLTTLVREGLARVVRR